MDETEIKKLDEPVNPLPLPPEANDPFATSLSQLRRTCEKAWFPFSLILIPCVVPKTLGASEDVCSCVALFLSISLVVVAFINEDALHAMFFGGTAFSLFVRVVNWIVAQGALLALLLLTDPEALNDDSATKIRPTLTAAVFLSLSYMNLMFCVSCAHFQGLSSVYKGAAGPVVVYAICVGYVVFHMHAEMLPLILTVDVMMILSFPFLHAVALGPRLVATGGAAPVGPKMLTTLKMGCLVSGAVSWNTASPKTVVLMMSLVPGWISSIPQTDVVSGLPAVVARGVLFIGGKLAALLFWVQSILPAAEVPAEFVNVLETEIKVNVKELGILVSLAIVLVQIPLMCLLMCCCRRQSGQSDKAKERLVRKRITKLRANSKAFPPPYPNGWYMLCRADEVPVDKAIPVSACGKEFAVFRGRNNGKIGVLDAFCPHLGTHLGYGGHVDGDGLVCPYHSWTFDVQGNCIDIPYCNKDISKMSKRTKTKSYTVQERLGLIFIWWHAEGEAPFYELTLLDAIDQKGMVCVGDVPCEDWNMHIMEPSQNSSDPYHFNTVHSWLGAEPGKKSPFWVRHECKTKLGLRGDKRENGQPYEDTEIDVIEKCTDMRLFGFIPLPKSINDHYSSSATFQGPGISTFNVDSKFLGSVKVVTCFTPQAPFVQRCTMRIFSTPSFPKFLARWLGRMARATINQDRPVWENKLAIDPRNVVAGDGPFAAYGQWLRQYYTESSEKWGDLSIEW